MALAGVTGAPGEGGRGARRRWEAGALGSVGTPVAAGRASGAGDRSIAAGGRSIGIVDDGCGAAAGRGVRVVRTM